MQADIEAGIFAGDAGGLAGVRFRDHQACAGENSLAMGAKDGGIDFRREAEIVGVYDQRFHGDGAGRCVGGIGLTVRLRARILLASREPLK
jgi:hypothetical protein